MQVQTVSQRLALLRQRMALRGLDACVVVTDDFHGSEYVGDHFKTRAYLSGFTGSAGTLLVLAEEAYLGLSLIRILATTRQGGRSNALFCLRKKSALIKGGSH